MGKLSKICKSPRISVSWTLVSSDLQFRGLLMLEQKHPAESFFEIGHVLICEEYALPCSSETARRFGITAEASCLHLRGRRLSQASSQKIQAELLIYYLAYHSTLKLEAMSFRNVELSELHGVTPSQQLAIRAGAGPV